MGQSSRVEVTQGSKRAVPRGSDYDMVEDFDLEQLPGPDQVTRHLYVGLRRFRLAARVVVQEDNGCGVCDDRAAEHLARVNEHGIQCPGRDEYVSLDAPPGVEQQRNETFHVRVERGMVDNMRAPVFSSPFGACRTRALPSWPCTL